MSGIEQEFDRWLPGTSLATELVADAQGDANVTWTLPASPLLVGQHLWLQGLSGVTAPLQLSPIAGGLIR